MNKIQQQITLLLRKRINLQFIFLVRKMFICNSTILYSIPYYIYHFIFLLRWKHAKVIVPLLRNVQLFVIRWLYICSFPISHYVGILSMKLKRPSKHRLTQIRMYYIQSVGNLYSVLIAFFFIYSCFGYLHYVYEHLLAILRRQTSAFKHQCNVP